MTDLKLYTKLSLLPLQQKVKVENFINSLKFKPLHRAGKLVKRKAGKAKGLIEMKDNFDEPIVGFDGEMQ